MQVVNNHRCHSKNMRLTALVVHGSICMRVAIDVDECVLGPVRRRTDAAACRDRSYLEKPVEPFYLFVLPSGLDTGFISTTKFSRIRRIIGDRDTPIGTRVREPTRWNPVSSECSAALSK